MRVFISIKLPTKILMKVKEIQEKLPEFTGKKTEIKNLHLTLKFFGEISFEKMEEIKEKLKEINFEKFEARIGKIGFFDKPKSGIVWLEINNCTLLQKEVDKILKDTFDEEKRFMGHLTIARVKKIKDKKIFFDKLNQINSPHIFFIVDRFYLMQSKLKKEGPEYLALNEYILK
ncbi:MAG TPA: RNA 2',3'-cyclic phosphodiesterase [Candidatus Pacearchaeota archaeon]|nr:RNA 2',3'-cyclic phosphodiesterase [Candidatus Pacearchaeota archaeon]